MSDVPGRVGSAILMSAEDDPARTIAPRLTAAGADLTKIHILESVILANGSETLPSLRADVDAITAAAERLGDCRLIAIDPVSAYLKGIDDNRNAVLRGVLTPLKRLAERLGAAVVLVSHLTKGTSANGKHRVLGSIAYVGACRANHLFVADPRDPTGRRVLLLDNGGNVAPPATTLAFVIEDRGRGPRVVWSDETVPITAGEALRPRQEIAGHELVDAQECGEWLRDFLLDGPKPSTEVLKATSTPDIPEIKSSAPSTVSEPLQVDVVFSRALNGPGSCSPMHRANSPSKGAQFFEGRMPVPCAPFDTTCSLRVGGRYYRQNQFNCKNACVVKPRFNREF